MGLRVGDTLVFQDRANQYTTTVQQVVPFYSPSAMLPFHCLVNGRVLLRVNDRCVAEDDPEDILKGCKSDSVGWFNNQWLCKKHLLRAIIMDEKDDKGR